MSQNLSSLHLFTINILDENKQKMHNKESITGLKKLCINLEKLKLSYNFKYIIKHYVFHGI